ncbi:hypothetical protein BDV96DRAFT_15738 [Lophiotrema nucula]|uniref:MYND-type domain-containing protein n=1 Tax=Lophiotrema nucula TaxID=690887 RepID=A0A6A5ZUC0_9PLEO|nr:hypothetical protein BDV96DRAFT_15738 [Lophiotrema nucula]
MESATRPSTGPGGSCHDTSNLARKALLDQPSTSRLSSSHPTFRHPPSVTEENHSRVSLAYLIVILYQTTRKQSSATMPPSEKVDLHHCQKCRAKPHIWETPFRTCHRCKMARYCSLICQSDHYDDHKAACQAEAEERIKMNLQDDYRADELLTADSEFITFRSEAAQAVKNIEGARVGSSKWRSCSRTLS